MKKTLVTVLASSLLLWGAAHSYARTTEADPNTAPALPTSGFLPLANSSKP